MEGRPDPDARLTARRLALRALGWFALAAGVTWPALLDPSRLLGFEEVDVWNHAWGFWYVAEALGRGALPYHSQLLGAPGGGKLYFIDTLGALWGLPITWTLGPAVAFNLVQTARVAAAGLAAQLLCEEVTGRGPHTWLAGVAYATSPFLLCELYNGISEVCAVSGVAFSLWALVRAFRRQTRGSWGLAGGFLGLTAATTFYYGLCAALLCALYAGHRLLLMRRRPWPAHLRGLVLYALAALALALPAYLVLRASLQGPDAFIERTSAQLDWGLLAHNAVDPRALVTPGDFKSVDLYARYGERMRHSGYLRWTVLLLAGVGLVAAWRRRRDPAATRPLIWLTLAASSALLAMGYLLFWAGRWVEVGPFNVTLPFYWLQRLLPQVAITHPLRMIVGAHAALGLLAALGLAALLRRVRGGVLARAALAAAACLVVGAEGLLGSAAVWPIPTAPAAVPVAAYAGLPADSIVLDLPTNVGRTMSMQRYFWYQTQHHLRLPYPPDIAHNRPRDPETISAFRLLLRGADTVVGHTLMEHIRQRYSAILLHTELERAAGAAGRHRLELERLLDKPEKLGAVLRWRLDIAPPRVAQ